jgi:hypothetical protein
LKNVVSLLKPGGMLVLMGVFNNPVYTVGHKVFKCLVMQKQEVHNAIEAAGLKVLEVYDYYFKIFFIMNRQQLDQFESRWMSPVVSFTIHFSYIFVFFA